MIYIAFAAAVAQFASTHSPALSVAWPDAPLTPPNSGSWLEVSWFPNETFTYGMADNGPVQVKGFGQVNCNTRLARGAMKATLTLADAIITAIPKGTVLDLAQIERQPWKSSALTAEDRIVVPVTFPYAGIIYT